MNAERKERRGFASMSPEKQREIASKGGRAAHQRGRRTSGPRTKPGRRAARVARSAAADAVGSWTPTGWRVSSAQVSSHPKAQA